MSDAVPIARGRMVGARLRSWTWSWPTASPIARESLVVLVVLALLGAAVFGGHILHGGFYNDDWTMLNWYRYREDHTLVGALEAFSALGYRPVGMAYWLVVYSALGLHTGLYLGLTVALGSAVATLVYVLLRTLGMARLHAGVIAVLLLLFPASDSTRLWFAASISNLGIAIYLAGVLVALRGLRATGRRALAWHGGAATLYLVGLLTYELVAGPIVLGVLLYRWRARWRPAMQRWAADVVAVAAALTWVRAHTWNHPQPLDGQLRHAGEIAQQSLRLLTDVALPFGQQSRLSVLGPLLAIVLIGALLGRLLAADDPARRVLRRWMATAGAGAIAIVAGYLMFVPAEPSYVPLAAGPGNRVNNLAAIGYVLLLYSLAMVVATLAFRGLRDARRWSIGFALLSCAVLAVGWVQRSERDARSWDRAARLQADVLTGIRRALPNPPKGAAIFTYGRPFPFEAAPGVTVFWSPWDFTGAVRTAWHDATLNGYLIIPGFTLECGPRSMTAPHVYSRWVQTASYRNAFIVDVSAGRAVRVDDRAACRAAADHLGRS